MNPRSEKSQPDAYTSVPTRSGQRALPLPSQFLARLAFWAGDTPGLRRNWSAYWAAWVASASQASAGTVGCPRALSTSSGIHNEAFVVFAGDSEVIEALQNMYAVLGRPNRLVDSIVTLVKEMAAEADVPIDLDDSFIEHPFAPPTR